MADEDAITRPAESLTSSPTGKTDLDRVGCPWPVGTVLRSTGAAFTWIFEHSAEGCWYEMGSAMRRDWAYVESFPNLVELAPAQTATLEDGARYWETCGERILTARGPIARTISMTYSGVARQARAMAAGEDPDLIGEDVASDG